MNSKKSISLVLGSGGARGYAHIGAIEELAKVYDIKSISGSSMGALIGGLYACDKLEEYKKWVLELDGFDVVKLLDISFVRAGMIKGEKVFKIIEEMIGDILIEDLSISYTAVATDIIKQKEVWIQKGKLIDAIRGSVAIPSIITPAKIDNRYLIDGGVVNPLPIAPTMSDNTDLTVAVALDAKSSQNPKINIPKKEEEKKNKIEKTFLDLMKKTNFFKENKSDDILENLSVFDVFGRSIDIMQNTILKYKTAGYSPDIVIGISGNACGFYEFNRAYELIELGKIITRKELKKQLSKV
jgi:NTE family protein